MSLKNKILEALGQRSQSTEELVGQLGSEFSSDDISKALYHLREQESLVVKHPVIGGGCKSCACSVSYVWRLSLSGRQELAKQQGT